MRHKRILKVTVLSLVAVAGVFVANPAATSALTVTTPITVMAAITCPEGQVHPRGWDGKIDNSSCCPGKGNPTAIACLISKYINPVVNLLAAILGIIVVGSVITAGIQYSSSGGDPGKVAAAKGRIANALLALAGFVFLYVFLQWVIPGGLL